MASALHVVAVDTWRVTSNDAALPRLFLAIVVDVFDVEGVNVARQVSQDRQANVDKEICVSG